MTATSGLKPFWRYYGGKWRAAPRYPKPLHDTIVEPFAGAAGYACRYPDRRVILVDKYPVIAGMWRYLIKVSPAEIRAIPECDDVDALPAWVPQEARWLVGFTMNDATTRPHCRLSAGLRRLRSGETKDKIKRTTVGWCAVMRERVASQVERIRHWTVIDGDYWQAPAIPATWYIDPPYANRAGSAYVHAAVDYAHLAAFCETIRTHFGQVIVCENEGATWLPFRPFATLKAGVNGKGSREVIWP